jgi:hypothetical protein
VLEKPPTRSRRIWYYGLAVHQTHPTHCHRHKYRIIATGENMLYTNHAVNSKNPMTLQETQLAWAQVKLYVIEKSKATENTDASTSELC